jgi:HD-GYP domain-containing protein (c-di-GMP phosphodiesterase class II)
MPLKLVPFSPQYLRLDDPLPFGLRAVNGQLLLAAGQQVPNAMRLAELRQQPLYADEVEAADWYRRLGAAVDQALRQGQTLAQVVAARPDAVQTREPTATATPTELHDQWYELTTQLDLALRNVQTDAEWRSRLFTLHIRARQLLQRRTDASLYCLAYDSIHTTQRYSSRHALLVMGVCELAAPLLGWPQDWIDSLGRAALTMNVAMLKLQDQLASSQLPPTPAMATEIAAHAGNGRALLEAGGLSDPLCLELVGQHHDVLPSNLPLAQRSPAQQLAGLLQRVDVFTAKFSRRASREPMSPVQALREACLVVNGRPDEVAGALLKAVGLYLPGCYVELVGGELAVVLARGRMANQPLVATLVAANGLPLAEPALRDTADTRYTVKNVAPLHAVKVRPAHAKLLALRKSG